MPSLPRRYWSEMTSEEFSRLDKERIVAVLPVAAIEQHGPHLPVQVDSRLIQGIVDHTTRLLPDDSPATFLPLQAIGKSNEHSRYPGTLTFSAETLIRTWMEIGDCVAAAGIRKLLLFNGHGGQLSIMDIVSRDLRVKHDMLVVSASWFSLGTPDGLFPDHEMRHGIHAGSVETSMMLALAPELVHQDKAVHFESLSESLEQQNSLVNIGAGGRLAWQSQDLNPQGAMGNASDADAERGQQLIDHAAQKLVELLDHIDHYPLSRLDQTPAW